MEFAANAVSAIFAHHREIRFFGVFLDGVSDVAEARAGLDHLDADTHRIRSESCITRLACTEASPTMNMRLVSP